jgi:hypothetical protein
MEHGSNTDKSEERKACVSRPLTGGKRETLAALFSLSSIRVLFRI